MRGVLIHVDEEQRKWPEAKEENPNTHHAERTSVSEKKNPTKIYGTELKMHRFTIYQLLHAMIVGN